MKGDRVVTLPDGRKVHPGAEISVSGWPGRYRYLGLVGPDGSLTVHGGPNGYGSTRSARTARVKTVHRPKPVE